MDAIIMASAATADDRKPRHRRRPDRTTFSSPVLFGTGKTRLDITRPGSSESSCHAGAVDTRTLRVLKDGEPGPQCKISARAAASPAELPFSRHFSGQGEMMMPEQIDDGARLLGAWRLVSMQVQMEDTGEFLDLHGPDPRGFIIFAPEGRMAVVVTSGGRKPPATDTETAALFRDMSAYTGRFRIEGNLMFNAVDVAWHPAWDNTRQPRFFALEGDRLTLTTEVQGHPSHPGRMLRGIAVWIREK